MLLALEGDTRCTVQPDRVIFLPPLFNYASCLLQCVKDFPIQQFVSHFSIERHNIAILPVAGRLLYRWVARDCPTTRQALRSDTSRT